MPAYVVALVHAISDAQTYQKYVAQVEATLAPFGGRFLARKPEPELLEGGDAPSRAVILAFPSEERARAWHASPAYEPVKKLRQGASTASLVLLPGYGNALKPPVHEVCYVEHVCDDVDATRRLFEQTHGWQFAPPDPALGGSLVATLPNGGRASVRAPLRDTEMPITRAYVRVADIDRSAKLAKEAGGKIALAPTPLEGHGKIAIVQVGGIDHGMWELPDAS